MSAPDDDWPETPRIDTSSTSAPAYRPSPTCTRWRSGWHRRPASSTATTTGRYKACGLTLAPRDRAAFTRFFAGLELVDPGVVLAGQWHPELGEPVAGQEEGFVSARYAGVARTR